jgi:hypothetical protein
MGSSQGSGLFGPLRRGAHGEGQSRKSLGNSASQANGVQEMDEQAVVMTTQDQKKSPGMESARGVISGPGGTPGYPGQPPTCDSSQELTFTCQLPMVLVVD